MMDDPWFTYFRGRGKMQITPRSGKGWAAVIAFTLAVTVPAFGLPWAIGRSPWLLVPYLLLTLLLTVAFVRWAITKSERVDLTMTAAELAEFNEWKRRGKR